MNVQIHCCIGGKNLSEDIRRLEHGLHIVSGTPGNYYFIKGRVFDMI